MATQPLMPKATAVWLVDNTALTFKQIAEFVGLHELEVSGIADGAVAVGIKGMDPVLAGQIERAEIERCEKNPQASLRLRAAFVAREAPRKGPRYTPLSKRQDKPAAIAWIVRNHPEVPDSQITKLVGTTKPTIKTIRERTHWNMANIKPIDPVALGLCSQTELDEAVAKSAKYRQEIPEAETGGLRPLDESLATAEAEPARESAFLSSPAPAEPQEDADADVNADTLFNLPAGDGTQTDEEEEAEAAPAAETTEAADEAGGDGAQPEGAAEEPESAPEEDASEEDAQGEEDAARKPG